MSRTSEAIHGELLVLRCRRGDAAAPRELVALFERQLLYYLRRLLPTENDAWDIAQDTWLSVFRALPKLQNPQAFPAFLFKTARNAAFANLRKRKVAVTDLDASPDSTLADDSSTDDEIFAREATARLHAALGMLPLMHRDVLTLHFLEDLSVSEIAEVVGVPPGTVKSRIFHAKQALRELLADRSEP